MQGRIAEARAAAGAAGGQVLQCSGPRANAQTSCMMPGHDWEHGVGGSARTEAEFGFQKQSCRDKSGPCYDLIPPPSSPSSNVLWCQPGARGSLDGKGNWIGHNQKRTRRSIR